MKIKFLTKWLFLFQTAQCGISLPPKSENIERGPHYEFKRQDNSDASGEISDKEGSESESQPQ